MSFDGYVSLFIFDDNFNLLGFEVGKELILYSLFVEVV